MPKRTDLHSILIIGAGPIVIGQACEFDYSGAQACKALREEGYRVVLVNSNPATIMTDPGMADATYIEPITWPVVEKIIARERAARPHEAMALLPTMGGQTALNCALDLHRHGVLARYGVEMIGASEHAIEKAEDRLKFKDAMTSIGLGSAKSGIAHSLDEAWAVQRRIQAEIGGAGFPMVIRPSFTLGGTGGGIAYNPEEFEAICRRGLDLSPTAELLIEESLIGWKEYEMEVVRDRADNCIIVCSIENLDPMGIHTGDSITVAPAQTLTDKEYQLLRNASIAILREIGVDTGGSNVQFAIDPHSGRMIVIEMNPRVSRSSALASKATGFPIAKIAAKLAVGYTLDELANDITGGATPASFEPSIDYVVTKVPRFAFEKFPAADAHLTTQMKSVGEVMAIGRTFQESLQKALRGLETGISGLDERSSDREEIVEEIGEPGPERLLYVADAFRIGMSLAEVHDETAIDPWFLAQIEDLVATERHQVDVAEKLQHERRGRAVVDLVGGADLLDAALVHDDHAVGDLERLLLVVGDEDAGHVDLVVQPAQPAAQLLADLGVERAEGLVEQQHLGLDGQGAGQRDALALAARELVRVALGQRLELDQAQQVQHAAADLRIGRPHRLGAHAQAEGDVLEDRQVAEQRVVLEDEAHAAVAHVGVGGVLAVEVHAAAVGHLEPGDDAQQRGLARTRGPQQRDQLARGHVEVDLVADHRTAEALAQLADLDAHRRGLSGSVVFIRCARRPGAVARARAARRGT